jgi:hypothetical protein
MALLAKIRQDWKSLKGKNALAYLAGFISYEEKKGFIKLVPGQDVSSWYHWPRLPVMLI